MDKERLLRYLNQKYMSKCEIACNLPLGMNADEVWNTILEERFSKRTNLPLRNIHGDCYWYVLTDKMIAAREKIVEGAVSMVKMALDKLSDEEIVELDEERKAAMVSNLLVVLCADEAAQPVVNTGTLHH